LLTSEKLTKQLSLRDSSTLAIGRVVGPFSQLTPVFRKLGLASAGTRKRAKAVRKGGC
jgi:hypothetical protein